MEGWRDGERREESGDGVEGGRLKNKNAGTGVKGHSVRAERCLSPTPSIRLHPSLCVKYHHVFATKSNKKPLVSLVTPHLKIIGKLFLFSKCHTCVLQSVSSVMPAPF